MSGQDQRIEGSQLRNSQVQLNQAGRDAVSFQNSRDNQVTINNALLQLGRLASPQVNWDWARRLLEKKQLPEIRKRLTDTLGRERALMTVSFREQLTWVGRSPLEPDRVLQIEGQGEAPLDPRQLLIETFGRDDIAGKLLILGTPGAGKTTALLSLAEQLVVGALDQPKTVIPVLFELSTWRKDNQSIRDWLIEQLYDQHGGNRRAKLSEQWLDQQVLLPLMDGLDELGYERQKECTQKLQEFAAQYPHLVVCCRTKEFTQVGIRLDTLRGAIRLEPLSDKQIRTFLDSQQSPLWSVLETTPQLQKLIEPTPTGDPGMLRIPLFVALTAQVYDPQHPFTTKADLLRQYIDWQLSRDVRSSDRRRDRNQKDWAYQTLEDESTRQQTLKTLAWIARQLQRKNQVELLIERIQPNWFSSETNLRQYQLITGLLAGLITGLLVGLITGLITGISAGLITGLLVGLITGLITGISAELDEIKPFAIYDLMSHEERQEFMFNFTVHLIIGLFCGLLMGLSVGLPGRLLMGLLVGLIPGLIGGTFLGLAQSLTYMSESKQQDLQLQSIPNQGIWNSLRSFLWTTIFSYPLGVSVVSITAEYSKIQLFLQNAANDVISNIDLNNLWQATSTYLIPGIFSTLLFSFFHGGITCVQHVCLRWVLWQRGIAPWNLTQFLNYCVERRLLQRVGGSYRFLHRELLDHFAEMR
jgi:hypothetical protein